MTPVIGISASTLIVEKMRGVHRFALSNDYIRCVTEAGGLPLILPNVAPDAAAGYLDCLDGLILSGGLDVDPMFYDQDPMPDLGLVDQVRDTFELALARGARERGMPLLAVCRGLQVMNVASGGSLLQHIPGQIEGAIKHDQEAIRRDALSHNIAIEPNTRLAELAGAERARVNTFHHQACDAIAEGFVISARAPDGVIEALEDPSHPFCLGVQWHPERCGDDPLSRRLFAALVEAAQCATQEAPAGP